ncbi:MULTISPECIES: ScpA family protein [unclassified Lysobacter]|uniref:segregation and condensation protein A n=1 Tax=unclassified Lysobacter TaxID=2635362 RepID=UPI0009EA3D4C|nr:MULTISPECIES: ScpA family protein [unclassified Lysobacter]
MTNENVSDEALPDEPAPDDSAADAPAAGVEPAPAAPEDTAPAAAAASRPQQQEMPLATIHGQPVLQIPQDLYIPPDALEVILDAFEGPLDLLLYLIRRQNLDILDIPVADITRQYVEYIQAMHEMRFELAADYLVMAAMLAEIKSRMLLPRAPNEEGIEEDPRADLVRRLQEYERFKKAAEDIDSLPRQDRDTVPVQAFVPDRASIRLPPPVDLKEMLLALHDVFKRAELYTQHAIKRDALSVRQRMGELLTRMADGVFHRFESLFTVEEGRLGVVVTFLGLLTLAKEQLIEIVQEGPLEPIYVKSLALMKDPDEIELSSEFDHAANDDPAG